MNRREVLRGMLAAGGAFALGACGTAAPLGAGTGGNARLTGGRVSVRWLGGAKRKLRQPIKFSASPVKCSTFTMASCCRRRRSG